MSDDSDDFDDIPATSVVELPQAAAPKQRSACVVVMSGSLLGRVIKLGPEPLVVGRAPANGLPVDDHGVSRHHARFEPLPDGNVLLVDMKSTNGVFCNGERVSERVLEDGDRVRLGGSTVLKFQLQDTVEEAFHQNQFDAARRDPLTGCYNKRYLLEQLDVELSFAKRHQRVLTLAMLDLDHFKQVNDTHGHLAGDAVLKAVVEIVQQCIRAEDVLVRYGGEEFIVIMRETHPQQASIVAERLRNQVQWAAITHDDTRIPVTVSVGVAAGPSARAETPHELIKLADEALYKAKRDGRNQVVVSRGR